MNQFAILTGGRAGWDIDHSFSFGAGAYVLTTSVEAPSDYIPSYKYDGRQYYLQVGYVGFVFQYTNSPNDIFHITANTLTGVGTASLTPNHWGSDNSTGYSYYDNTLFFLLEPGLGLEMNVFRYFKIEFGLSYRIISGSELKAIENNTLSGLSTNIAFKLGSF